LATSAGTPEEALRLYERAHKLAPQERSVALLYAEALYGQEMPSGRPFCLSPSLLPTVTQLFWKRSPMP